MKTVLVRILKNSTGDISGKNKYRPISLATVIAKLLEGLLNKQLKTSRYTIWFQGGPVHGKCYITCKT